MKSPFLFQQLACFSCAFFLLLTNTFGQTDPNHPNILLIIADDMGTDALSGYEASPFLPSTPHIDSLRSVGLTFMNAWAAPKCTPTRASLLSGKFGIQSGVTDSPGELVLGHESVFTKVAANSGGIYSDSFFGKWHVSMPVDPNHPNNHGIDHFEGFMDSNVPDYYSWEKVTNGLTSDVNEYVSAHLTNSLKTWVNNQNSAWFTILSHGAPHGPYHTPPAGTYTLNPNNNKRRFLAAIESIDYELGRLFDSMPLAVKNNTIVIFAGDNGTPSGILQNFPAERGKGTLYEGGVKVPFIVSGKGVSRQGETEEAMVHMADLYASILELTGSDLPGGIYNSLSFESLLSNSNGTKRPYNYTEIDEDSSKSGWAIRNQQYKLINFENGIQEFYDLINDPYELNDLIGALNASQVAIKIELEDEAREIRNYWSCQDLIQNGAETGIDTDCDLSLPCSDPGTTSQTNIGCCATPAYLSFYEETSASDIRTIKSNDYPSHEFCHAANVPSPMIYEFQMDATPSQAAFATSVVSGTNRPSRFYGVALNGVLLAPAPALPFVFENPNTGEYNWNWVFEPTNNQGQGQGNVSLDCSSGHTGGQGYHYHGNPFQYMEENFPGITTSNSAPAQPIHIGWANDGYPILYRYGPDGTGGLALLQPSYQLKSGDRPGDGISGPCGPYNGKYTKDYEFVATSGDLDECNGIERNINVITDSGTESFDYFYVITDAFPQIGRCTVGTPDPSFNNSNDGDSTPRTLSTNVVPALGGTTSGAGMFISGSTVSVTATAASNYSFDYWSDGGTIVSTNPNYSFPLFCDLALEAHFTLDIIDSDNDGVQDSDDICPGGDDTIDSDMDGVPDACDLVSVNFQVFLEGALPSNSNLMRTQLQSLGLLPASQPYSMAPYLYNGTESLFVIPSNVVDWILIEAYSGDPINGVTLQESKAGFLLEDGTIVNASGTGPLRFSTLSGGSSFYFAIRHRNHLDILSPTAFTIDNSNTVTFDFTSNDSYGVEQQKDIASSAGNIKAMHAGDYNADNVIQTTDYDLWKNDPAILNIYEMSDGTLDGTVQNTDFDAWEKNKAKLGLSIF